MHFFYKVNGTQSHETVYSVTLQFTTLQIQDKHAYISIKIAWNLCESLGESTGCTIYYICHSCVSL